MRGLANWNARAKFLVLIQQHGGEDDEKAIVDVFRELWRHLAADAAVARAGILHKCYIG